MLDLLNFNGSATNENQPSVGLFVRMTSGRPAQKDDSMKQFSRRFLTIATVSCLSAALLSACVTPVTPAPKTDGVFLVRHAEKTTDKTDPALTAEGALRAEALADRLADEGITQIHSSDYVRTRATAAPLAKRLGLDVAIYDLRDLPAMAAKLKTIPGRHLVVGHSNTTPQLTELLGGDGGEPIVEATEYDRLYWVTTSADEPVVSYLSRYGAASKLSGEN